MQYSIDPSLKERVVLIRHGMSESNEVQDAFLQLHHKGELSNFAEVDRRFRLDLRFVDSYLHPIGKQQAILQRETVNRLNIRTVFVSPLRRALQTCYFMFRTHPNRDQIRFTVMPIITEVCNQPGCISLGVEQLKKETAGLEIKFDFQLLESQDEFWQLRQVAAQPELAQQLIALCGQTGLSIPEAFAQLLAKTYPTQVETYHSTCVRAKDFNYRLLEHLSANPANENEKVAVVGHNAFFQCLTFRKIDARGFVVGTKFRNCEIVPYGPYSPFPDAYQ